jgi:hypothetical protein
MEQLLEEAVVRAFPPAARWGEPWPPETAEEGLPAFAPRAPSYAAALRNVAAGRRRVRVQGSWLGGGPGAVQAGAARALADEEPAWVVLATDR